jgi:hypothetical protein
VNYFLISALLKQPIIVDELNKCITRATYWVEGNIIYSSKFAITVHFSSIHNTERWKLTAIYDPCHGQDRMEFINWLNDIQIGDQENWMFIRDINFYRSMENRNREGGNMHDIMIFNEVISNLALQEIPLKGRNYTWRNMQHCPLLEQLDWCFISAT